MAYSPKSMLAWLNRERYEMNRKAKAAAETKVKASPEYQIRSILAEVLGYKGNDTIYARLVGYLRSYKASASQEIKNTMVFMFKLEIRFHKSMSDKDIKKVYRDLLVVI